MARIRCTRLVPVLLAAVFAGSLARADRIGLAALFDAGLQPPLSGLSWSPDGGLVAGFWKEGERKGLRAFEATTGRDLWTVWFDELSEAPNEDVPVGRTPPTAAAAPPPLPAVAAFSFRPGSSELLLVAGADLFLWEPPARTARRLTRSEGEEEGARFSPDGGWLAFSRDADLWALEVESGHEIRLTSDGRRDELLNGTTDWVYWEEIWNRSSAGLWWSPDGSALAFYRFDVRGVPSHPLLEARDGGARVKWQKYPRAGEANAAVAVRVVDLARREVRTLATGADPDVYLARVTWRPDGGAIAVERLDREQTRLELLLCDPAATVCRTVATQVAATWINLTDDFRFLPDGGFLWSDERSGWRTLRRYAADGRELTELLPAPWVLDAVEGIFAGTGEVVVSSWRRDLALGASRRQVLALPLS
ncbi:MAG: hypothetical protein F9K18_01840, partial [Thermoanaerobaculia bacterium]